MLGTSLLVFVKNGKKPIVKFTKDSYDYIEESVDPHMMCRIIGAEIEYVDSIRCHIDLNGFEEYNKSVASRDWRDENGEPRLTWFETSHYPKDGFTEIYLPLKEILPLEIVEEHSLLSEYVLTNCKKTYPEWLEEQVLHLRSKLEESR